MPSEFVLGFNPGGSGAFGWCISQDFGGLLQPQRCGVGDNAEDVFMHVSNCLHGDVAVVAIGISAPLHWNRTGSRAVDRIVLRALQAAGHHAPSGTVQQLNSLQGACLVQGLLLAEALWRHYDVPITETHPKALLHLDPGLGANPSLPDDMQDAEVSAWAAWQMHQRAPGWRDLCLEEPSPVHPLGTPVSYWMPIP